jgi:hypothetical protein
MTRGRDHVDARDFVLSKFGSSGIERVLPSTTSRSSCATVWLMFQDTGRLGGGRVPGIRTPGALD